MAVEISIQAMEKGPWKKGYPISVFTVPHEWGSLVAPPYKVILRITDADIEEVKHYTRNWKIDVTYEVLVNNPQGYRIQVTLPNNISTLFPNYMVRQDLKDYFADRWGVQVVGGQTNDDVLTFDLPKPITDQWMDPPVEVTADDFKADVLDKFNEQVDVNRYHFTEADVDTALANNGYIELTKAQVLARVVDRQA